MRFRQVFGTEALPMISIKIHKCMFEKDHLYGVMVHNEILVCSGIFQRIIRGKGRS